MKKLLIGVFVGSLLLANWVQAEDTSWHPYHLGIDYVKSRNIMVGDPDGSFRPDDLINRAELMKVLMETRFPGEASGGNCFPDVQSEWFAKYVCTAESKGIVEGYPDGYFRPGENINFVEAMKMVVGSYGYSVTPDPNEWYKPYVQVADRDMVIPESVGGFGSLVTRAEVAELITRFEKRVEGSLMAHLSRHVSDNMGMLYPNTYEMLTGNTFWVWDDNFGEYGSSVLTGYTVVDIEDVWGEMVSRTYFVVSDSAEFAFTDYFKGLVEQGNTINKVEGDKLLFAIGAGSDPGSFASTADVPWKTVEALFASSEANPVQIRVVIPVNLGGMGAPAYFTYAEIISEEY